MCNLLWTPFLNHTSHGRSVHGHGSVYSANYLTRLDELICWQFLYLYVSKVLLSNYCHNALSMNKKHTVKFVGTPSIFKINLTIPNKLPDPANWIRMTWSELNQNDLHPHHLDWTGRCSCTVEPLTIWETIDYWGVNMISLPLTLAFLFSSRSSDSSSAAVPSSTSPSLDTAKHSPWLSTWHFSYHILSLTLQTAVSSIIANHNIT